MADTTILIHDPEVVRARLGDERTERTPEEIEQRRLKVAETLARFWALPHDGEPLTDADLYDEDGLPHKGGDFSKTDIAAA